MPGTVGDLPYSCEVKVLVAQSYPMLCDRMDRNPPGSSIHGILRENTLESPSDCKEIKPVNPKGNQPGIFIGRTDAKAEALIFWPPDVKS